MGFVKLGWLSAVAVGGLMATAANAALVIPGGLLFPAPGEPDPVGGTVLQTITVPFTSATYSGRLTSTVISGDTTNVLGGMTFTYQFTNTDADASPTGINRLTVIDFTGFTTDMSHQVPSVGTLAPTLVDRGLAGQEVGFSFYDVIGPGSVRPGQTSAVLVVQTNAPTWVPSVANVINGSVTPVDSLGPAIPEPATIGLMAAAGMLFIRRRR